MLMPGTNHSIFHYHMLAVCLERATIISDQSHIILRNITMLITLLIAFPLSVVFAKLLLFPYYTVILRSRNT